MGLSRTATVLHAVCPVFVESHFAECSRLAGALTRQWGWRFTFVFDESYGNAERDAARCRREGFDCVDFLGEPFDSRFTAPRIPPPPRPGLTRLLGKVRALLSADNQTLDIHWARALLWSFVFPRLWLWLAGYKSSATRSLALLAKLRPDVLLLAEDNVDLPTASLIRGARALKTPTVIVPFSVSNPEEVVESRRDLAPYRIQGWRAKLFAARHPHWEWKSRDTRLLRLPCAQALAIEVSGLAPPLPWIFNSGDAAVIAAESPRLLQTYLLQGLPRGQLALTGCASDDLLFSALSNRRNLRQSLLQSRGLPESKPMLLVAFPQDQSAAKRGRAEFRTYSELIEAWGSALAMMKEFAVFILPHPRTHIDSLARLEEQHGLSIVDRDIVELIPLCDVFVAAASATIRLAVACGKPTINYDCERYGYSDYSADSGVVNVDSQAAFRSKLAAIDAGGVEALHIDVGTAGSVSPMIDGRSVERIARLVEQCVADFAE